jgi:hypothetical protein
MLTVLYPELLPRVQAFPSGLLAIYPAVAQRPTLVVKVVKEAILAAQLDRGFKIYVPPLSIQGESSAT